MTLPTVEVIGPWLQNKGDVLNLWSVLSRLEGAATPAVSSTLGLDKLPEDASLVQVRWKPSLRQVAGSGLSSHGSGIRALRNAIAMRILPRSVLHRQGFVRGEDVRALLDCSGYAYGDAWATPRMQRREAYYRKLKNNGAVLVLLPQALGPFEKPDVREWATKLLSLFDLIYARDEVSKAHVDELGLPTDRIGLAPDITHLLRGRPVNSAEWGSKVCIVPNARMIDRTDPETGAHYRGFLLRWIQLALDHDLDPVLLIHERNDAPLAEELRSKMERDIPIVNEDALTTKGILGSCYLAVSSRYHAIVSALSQGTPVVGTSWSHKYDELFRQYQSEDLLVSPVDAGSSGMHDLDEILHAETRNAVAGRLKERAADQKEKVEQMWQDVESRLPFLEASR